MRKIKKLALVGFLSLMCGFVNSQIIDNYGIRIGLGLSNQYWNYNNLFPNLQGWRDLKSGYNIQIECEKSINHNLSIKPSIGYFQKGFSDHITLYGVEGEVIKKILYKLYLHDISFNVVAKLVSLNTKYRPYLLIGFRGDYLLDYNNVFIDTRKNEYLDTPSEIVDNNIFIYDNFNNITFGGLIGIGLKISDLLNTEFEFNPPITKNYKTQGLSISDIYFDLTIGININNLIKAKSE